MGRTALSIIADAYLSSLNIADVTDDGDGLATGWTIQEIQDCITVLITHGARMDESSYPRYEEFKKKVPGLNINKLEQTWNSMPVLNGDNLSIKIHEFESHISH